MAKIKIIIGDNSCQPALMDCSGDLPKGFAANKSPAGQAGGNGAGDRDRAVATPGEAEQGLRQLLRSLVG